MKKLRQKKYDNELVVSLEVVELDMAEKLKYGVPVIPVFYLYPYFFGILSGKMNYTRKVFLTHENGEESTKFVTFTVKNKVVVACIEFDSYDI